MMITGTCQMVYIYEVFIGMVFPEWTVWLASYFSYGMGAGFGAGALRWPKFGVITVGATIGFVFGQIIDLAIVNPFASSDSIAHIITIIVVLIASCILSVIYLDHSVIVCCCMCGSYIFFRGISIIFGGYPNEGFMSLVIREGNFKDLRSTFWIYFAFMTLGFVGSTIWQFYRRSQNKDLYTYKGSQYPMQRQINYAPGSQREGMSEFGQLTGSVNG